MTDNQPQITLYEEVESELSELEKLVFAAIGEASMAWKIRPHGEFDDQKALDISHKLINDIQELFKV